jgi:hypothetical protein
MDTDVREEQPENACAPMEVTPSGIDIDLIIVTPLKQLLGMESRPFGKTISYF